MVIDHVTQGWKDKTFPIRAHHLYSRAQASVFYLPDLRSIDRVRGPSTGVTWPGVLVHKTVYNMTIHQHNLMDTQCTFMNMNTHGRDLIN